MRMPAEISVTGMSLCMRCMRTYSGTIPFISASSLVAVSSRYGEYSPRCHMSYSLVPATTRTG